jgi:hypothetical protein
MLIVKKIPRQRNPYKDNNEKLAAVLEEIEVQEDCQLISLAPMPEPSADWPFTTYIAVFRRHAVS